MRATVEPWADVAPFSWFVGVAIGAGVYYLVADRQIRQDGLVIDEKVGTQA